MKRMTKKLVTIKLAIAMAMFASSFAFAAGATVDVVMTIQDLNVEASAGSIAVMAAPASTRVTDRMVYKNIGNGDVHFAVKVTSTTGNWTLVQTAPQENQYRLSAIWHQWDAKPTSTEFQDNDILTGSDQTSSDTKFFNDNETHSTTNAKGSNVKTNEERNLYVKFESPASGTGSAKAHINVTAIAAQ